MKKEEKTAILESLIQAASPSSVTQKVPGSLYAGDHIEFTTTYGKADFHGTSETRNSSVMSAPRQGTKQATIRPLIWS
ncbi:hypothetical protein CBM2585_A160001 [Cupriavidus taiwanensis]|nr:hypothetical protein CBM2585_A160001 [Cupriavidus taiwanensis]